MIIDSHTHIYPDAKASQTLQTVKERSHILSYSDGTEQGLLASMTKAGIDLSIVSNIATRPKQVKSINQWLWQRSSPKIIALATWHPDLTLKIEALSDLKQNGFKGFKMHPDYQGFFVDDRRMFAFYDAAAELGLPILFHAGLDLGLLNPIHCTPRGLRNVLEAFPKLRIIAAHMGGDQMWAETEEHLLAGIFTSIPLLSCKKCRCPYWNVFSENIRWNAFSSAQTVPGAAKKKIWNFFLPCPS